MPDNVITNPGAGGATFRTLDDGTANWPANVTSFATTVSPGANVLQVVTPSNGLPVAQQGSWSFSLTGPAAVTGPLTDAELRATPLSVTGPLTDAQLRATAVPVSLAAVPLPSGAATEATLSAVNVKLPALATRPSDNEAPAIPVRPIGQEIWNVSFSEVGASVISSQFQAPTIGTGVGYSQASGSLAITTGTSTNAEFFTRSTQAWRGALRLKFSTVLSQRIVNNNFAVLLADLIGEGLTVTINSATSITVSQAGHSFTSTSVGQFVHIGRIVGAAGVPGRYAIASVVAGVSYNLTVAGWPASGTCTATVFGHSYSRHLFTGTTATAVNVDAQRRGWATGDTAATINTTASPGTVITCELTGREVYWADQLRASTTTPAVTVRANRIENIPDDNLDLYVFVWSFNGTVAPASTTTWTISFMSVEKYANTPVYLQGVRAQGATNPLPVAFPAAQAVTVSSGTVTVNALPAGTNAIGDVGVQYRANATGAATPTIINSPATPAVQTIKGSAGRLLGFVLCNTNVAARFFKVFNATAPTLGTTAAVIDICLPTNQVVEISFEGGIGFATAITCAITGGRGATNNTAITLDDVTGITLHA